MRLQNLLVDIPHHTCGTNPDIRGIATHSGRVREGDVFVALGGDVDFADRHPFVPQAVRAGAKAVVAEREVDAGDAVVVQTENTHRALAHIARRFYGCPTDALTMIGVTGTNGKTSTAHLIYAVLDAAGLAPGLIGTIEHRLGPDREVSNNSTPQAHDLHRLFRGMVDAGCQSAVMEVTSHGLAQDRVLGIDYDLAAFTNLTRDHLDYHDTPAAYLAAKARLFDGLRPEAYAIVNADDAACGALIKNCSARLWRYGRSRDARVRIVDGRAKRLWLQTPVGEMALELALQGAFQLYNVAAAVSVGLALGVAPEIIAEALREVRVPGRFEGVDCGQDFAVVVDYAHAPDGLKNVLQTARASADGRLICVFGCGGDRDRGKRPTMGALAAQLADLSVVTSDNPRTEDPDAIIADILPGMGDAPHLVEPDRRRAIEKAIAKARPGDLVLIAGKGHEDYQEVCGVKTPFDDREVAREILRWKV